jgi:hypothetical protein
MVDGLDWYRIRSQELMREAERARRVRGPRRESVVVRWFARSVRWLATAAATQPRRVRGGARVVGWTLAGGSRVRGTR